MTLRSYQPSDELAVRELWSACGLTRPWNDPRKDIERKLSVDPENFWVIVVDGGVVATAMIGYDGHRGVVNYLAVHPEYQRSGIGRAIMARAEEVLRELGCPKINLHVRTENLEVIEFYKQLGYEENAVVSLGKRLIED